LDNVGGVSIQSVPRRTRQKPGCYTTEQEFALFEKCCMDSNDTASFTGRNTSTLYAYGALILARMGPTAGYAKFPRHASAFSTMHASALLANMGA